MPESAKPNSSCRDLPPELAHHPKYRILRELGRGGMGVVYQARHEEMDRQVVIKVINRALLDRPQTLERFQREVRAAAKLSHPNIVTAYDAERVGDSHMLVMEFVPGQSLAEVVQKNGPLPLANACHYGRQVALGLQHAHERNLVHRDIKPQNLMLTLNNQVKILDFGLAKVLREEDSGTGLTSHNAYMGTPDYCAPEQAQDARSADTRADLYSLGCTLYYLLSGRPPFRENTVVNTILAHLQKPPRPLPELRAEVPAGLWQVVARLLAKEPGQRYQKPTEVVQALAPFVKSGDKPDAKSGSMPVVGSPGKGTVIAENNRQINKVLQEVPGQAPPQEVPAKDKVSPFETLGETSAYARKVKPSRKAAKPSSKQKWLIVGGIAVFLVVLLGLWASGVFRLKTPEGTLPEQQVARVQPGSGRQPKKPGLLLAPFAEMEAKSAQAAWAAYLGGKVEEDVALGNGVRMTMVLIPAGKFRMGAPKDEEKRDDDEDQHEVEITRAFYVGKYEVTQEQYQQIVGQNPSWFSADGGGKERVKDSVTRRFPVENVSWEEAVAFCGELTDRDGKRRYRLPSEAEWEYACRAGTTTPFHFGQMLNGDKANCDGKLPYGTEEKGRYLTRTCRVGSHDANAFGLHDMHGNVWEWCQDYYGPYKSLELKDPLRTDKGDKSARVLRGGSWRLNAGYCRAAIRLRRAPGFRYDDFGFRVAFRLD